MRKRERGRAVPPPYMGVRSLIDGPRSWEADVRMHHEEGVFLLPCVAIFIFDCVCCCFEDHGRLL